MLPDDTRNKIKNITGGIVINASNLWIDELPGEDRYLTRGGVARVYLEVDNRKVIKLNDAVYYTTSSNAEFGAIGEVQPLERG